MTAGAAAVTVVQPRRMNEAVIVQQPEGMPAQLMLLFHGVGADPRQMLPLAQRLAQQFPQGMIVSVPGRQPADLAGAGGFQWFSVQGISEENRPARIAEAMPEFIACVRDWQQRSGVAPAATALLGFSQGAIMALESTQLAEAQQPLCGRIVALSGRFAATPTVAPPLTTLHLAHGKTDGVIHYGHTVRSAEHLLRLGADLTADVIPFLGHQINAEVIELVVQRLTTYVPERTWREALRNAPG